MANRSAYGVLARRLADERCAGRSSHGELRVRITGGGVSASFTVRTEDSSAATVSVHVTIGAGTSAPSPQPSPPPPPSTGGTLYVTCPANKTVASSTGSAVAVTYSATTEGGVAPVTVSGTPASGSLFPVGTTKVNVNARSSDGQSSWCSFTVTVTYASAAPAPAPPPSTSSYGPRSTITCPAGAVDIWPGVNIQSVVNIYARLDDVLSARRRALSDQLDQAEDGQYVCRRVRRDPRRQRLDDGR